MKEEEINDTELVELQERVKENKTIKRKTLDMGDGGKVVNWFERMVQIVDTYGIKTITLTFLLIASFIGLIMFANAIENQHVIEKWLSNDNTTHTIGADIRKEINPKVIKTMTKLLYKMEADRVSILEMHNGKENPTALPFTYCDMTYEESMDRIPYISEEYVDLNMSKFTFPSYLYDHRYFIGSVEEIYSIDKKLAMRLDANNVKYCGLILIRTNIDIGFLMLSYLDIPNKSNDLILAELSYYVQEIGTYLDYAKQVELKNNKK